MTASPSMPATSGLGTRRLLYLALLAIQAACVTILIWQLLPIFWRIVDGLGETQDLTWEHKLVTCLCVAVFQTCYWWRLKRLGVPFATSSQLLSHLFLFAGRLSFIFASTFASVVFFRHLPLIDSTHATLEGLYRLMLFFAVLFSWFCFALEIERLGK